MAERRNYIALDWVTSEIEETLQQARSSLEDYVSDREDFTKLRFCLTYAHQVHGSLKMVELHGAALLATEIEQLAHALVEGQIEDTGDALESLMAGFLHLSAYVHRISTTRQDQPAKLLPTLNELRAARGEDALSEAAVFNPDVEAVSSDNVVKPTIKRDEFNELIRKLRQYYQAAMVGIVRDLEVEKNYELMLKVCARLHKVSANTASESLWKISHAVIESLSLSAEPASAGIKTVLRQIDNEIKKLQDYGRDALEKHADSALLKSLLYTVARVQPDTELIREVQQSYRLKEALPELDATDNIALPDSDAIRSVIGALNEEISAIQDVLDLYARGEHSPEYDIATLGPAFQRVINTLSVLGAVDALTVVREQQQRVSEIIAKGTDFTNDELEEIAAQLVSVQDSLDRSKTIADTRQLNIESGQIDQAHESVIREARHGLDQIKEAIVEFVASQWDTEPLVAVPKLLQGIRGGLNMVPLHASANVLESCEQYVQERLLNSRDVPEWQMLDTLADAITSVEFYLDCLLGDTGAELDSILAVAEESAALLGYPVEGSSVDVKVESVGQEPSPTANVIDLQAHQQRHEEVPEELLHEELPHEELPHEELPAEEDVQFNWDDSDEDEDIIDEEVIEIFIEEAAEVLETIDSYLPQWQENSSGEDALDEIRRAFHTLKGSGRMVGATDIGELAWSVENVLNRIIEGARAVTPVHLQLVKDAAQCIPAMVEAFESGSKIDASASQLLMQQASDLVSGKSSEADVPVEGTRNEPVIQEAAASEESVSETQTTAPLLGEDDDDLVDEEIIEIFVEEATEVLEAISEYMPQWVENRENADALTEIRRAFHTLKGSGRMVGATDVGELAWSIENMLNRVIDGSQASSETHQYVVQQVLQIAPQLVEAFEARQIVDLSSAEQMTAIANRLADGEQLGINELSRVEEPEVFPVAETLATETEIDTTLLEIFAGEAAAHLEVIKSFVNHARQGGEERELEEDLQRALHTLKGSAHMAEIKPIADIVTPVERAVKELRGCHLKADEDVVNLLEKATEFLEAGLEQLYSTPQQVLPGDQEFIEVVQQLHQQRLAAFAEQDEQVEGEQKSSSLMVEGIEKLLQSADRIFVWIEQEQVSETVDSVIEELQDVHQIAIDTEYDAIADIAGRLVQVYQYVKDDRIETDASFFDLIQRSHEKLIDMMDVVAAGQAVRADQALIGELDASISAGAQEPVLEVAQETVEEFDKPMPEAEAEAEAEAEDMQALAGLLPDLDEEMLEIFMEEAGDLLEGIEESLESWLRDPSAVEPVDELKRLLHTLKGGARLTGVIPLGDLSHAYETFIEQDNQIDDAFFAQLQRFQDRLHGMIDLLMGVEINQPVQVVGVSEAASVVGAEAVVGDDAVDDEIIEIFLEEARDLQESIDGCIYIWMDDRDDLSQLEDLKRLLHTLKGGARLAGMTSLGNLSHNFETFLINSEQRQQIGESSFFDSIQIYQDQLAAMMDEIVSHLQHVPDTGVDMQEKAAEPVTEGVDEHAASALEVEDNVVPFAPVGRDVAPALPSIAVPPAAVEATRTFIDNFEKGQTKSKGPQEVVKVSAQLLEDLVNLAGETSISRGRLEEQISEMGHAIEEMDATIDRIKGQLRRLEIETEAQILFRQEQVESEGIETFDPLEMDRYSHLQQLAKSLVESASDIQDVKETFSDKIRDLETLLLQQSRINTELQEGLMRSQMVPFSRMVPRLRRIVRQVSGELGKQVDLRFDNIEGELDRTVLERMVAPLEHMLRNAVDHGIETVENRRSNGKAAEGIIALGLAREGGEVVLTLRDDGAGIDLDAVKAKATERGLIDAGADLSSHEILQFILNAGFSTAKQVTQISGRGVGMDVVHSEIKQLGGSMDIQSVRGHGSTFTVRLPFTVSVNRALMVCIGSDTYAIPLNTIEGIVRVSPYELEAYYQPDAPAFEYAGQSYRLRYMGSLLHSTERPRLEGQSMPLPVVLVRGGEHSIAVQVDRLLGSREIVVKTLGPQFSMVEGLSGATVLGDGSVVVILDLMAMIRADMSRVGSGMGYLEEAEKEAEIESNTLVMVVDDSVTVRKVASRFLERQGMDVILAKDGVDAMAKLQELEILPDVMLLDIEMPRMDGFEVASRVRHTERLKEIPIIMITSRTGEKHRERALSLGVNEYLGKPYQEVELLETIGELTGKEFI